MAQYAESEENSPGMERPWPSRGGNAMIPSRKAWERRRRNLGLCGFMNGLCFGILSFIYLLFYINKPHTHVEEEEGQDGAVQNPMRQSLKQKSYYTEPSKN